MSPRRRKRALVPWGLVALVVVVFGPTIAFDLLKWDDWVNVTANPYLREPRLERLGALWGQPYEGLYIPLTYTVFSAEAALSAGLGAPGPDPRVFHAGNVVLHALCVVLVFLLLRRLTGSLPAAAAGGALFAVHPLAVESVAWVSEAKGLLAAGLVVLALWVHAGPPSPRALALTTLAFGLALLAKPTAVAFPLLVLVMDLGVLRRRAAWTFRRIGPWAVLAIALAVLTKRLQPDAGLAELTPIVWRPVVALDAIGFYVSKVLLPIDLAFDYGRSPSRLLDGSWWRFAAPALLMLVAAARRPRSPWSLSLAWLIAALVPVLGLVPFAFQFASTVADRYAYLALLGPAFLLASWLRADGGRRAVVVTAVAIGGLSIGSAVQSRHWRSDEALFRHALRVNPESFNALDGLGMIHQDAGRPEEALRHLDLAVQARPDDARVRIHRAGVLRDLGRPADAASDLAVAESLRPGDVEVELALGQLAHSRGDLEAAERHYRNAIDARGDFAPARYALATCLWAQGDETAAVREYEALLHLVPDHFETLVDLGKLRMNARDGEGAIRHWRKALALRPGDPMVRAYLRAAETGGPPPRPR